MIQATSRQVYNQIVLPTIGDRQMAVYQALEERPNSTNAELAVLLNWPINCLTPRMHELRKLGLVRQAEKRKCRATGHTAIAWEVVPEKVEQSKLFF